MYQIICKWDATTYTAFFGMRYVILCYVTKLRSNFYICVQHCKVGILHLVVDVIGTIGEGRAVCGCNMKRPCLVSYSQGRWIIKLAVTKEVQQQLNVRLFPWMTMALTPATNPGSGSIQQLGFMNNS